VAVENAAICLRRLNRNAESLAMYQELRRDFGPKLSPKDRAAIEQVMSKLHARVGQIIVTSNQPQSSIVVDGEQRALTPLAGAIVVDAGTHTVRVSKDGFETFQTQVSIAGAQTATVSAELKALAETGILVVREDQGRTLNVAIDGADVGTTPVWSGRVAVGTRTVLLRGPHDWGTAPVTTTVRPNQTTTLTLHAVVLDSEVRIEPTPPNGVVYIDGVEVGSGVWQGRLSSGRHRIEVAATGFVPYRQTATVERGKRTLLTIALQRDLSNPMWRVGFSPHIYLEAVAGMALSTSFAGGADAACGRGECDDRSRPLGFLAGARAGYQLTPGLGVELGLGYLTLKESMTRRVTASVESRAFTSADYQDETRISGAFASGSASYRFFQRTPLTVRTWVGVARVKSTFANQGTYTGQVANPNDPTDVATVSQAVSVPEQSPSIWLPFFGPEVRFGVRLGERVTLDAGVGLFLFLAPDTPRSGRNGLSTSAGEGARKVALHEVQGGFADGSDVRPGVLSLPHENGFGTFIAVVPSLAGRFDL